MLKFTRWTVLLVGLCLAACGGGGGGAANPAAPPAVPDTPAENPIPAGSVSRSYRLVVSGNPGIGALKGLQFALSLPAGAVLRIDSISSSVLPESLALSGQAPADALLVARYAAGSAGIAVITATGFSAGEFATLTCDLAAGATAPAAPDFVVRDLSAVDLNGNLLSGISVAVIP